MAWVKVDDGQTRSRQVKRAAKVLAGPAPRGRALQASRGRVLAVWLDMTSWCSRPENLSDGFFPDDEIELLPDARPLDVLTAMASGDDDIGPMTQRDDKRGGWILTDYGDNQLLRADILETRRKERERKRLQRGGSKTEVIMQVPFSVPRGRWPDSVERPSEVVGREVARRAAGVGPSSGVPGPSQPGTVPENPTQEHQEQPPGGDTLQHAMQRDGDELYRRLVVEPPVLHGSLLTEAEALRMGAPPAPEGVIERRLMAAPGRPPDEAPDVLTRLAHAVLDRLDAGELERADVDEAFKTAAARHGLRYDGDRARKALDSAEAQRERQTPAQAALRTATAVLRVVAPTAVPIEQFHRLVFAYVQTTWPHPDFAPWRDEVVSILFRADWYASLDRSGRVVPEKAGPPGKQKIVGYHWRLDG